MENKSILIQSDEVTKNIMSEIQEDMVNSISEGNCVVIVNCALSIVN